MILAATISRWHTIDHPAPPWAHWGWEEGWVGCMVVCWSPPFLKVIPDVTRGGVVTIVSCLDE